jgi:hypothetical protein
MIRRLPGLFAAGEMLDWEAPPGGYMQASFATAPRRGGARVSGLVGKHRDRKSRLTGAARSSRASRHREQILQRNEISLWTERRHCGCIKRIALLLDSA